MVIWYQVFLYSHDNFQTDLFYPEMGSVRLFGLMAYQPLVVHTYDF